MRLIDRQTKSSSELLWELRGRTIDPVTCVLRPARNGAYLVSVILGDNRVYAEQFDRKQEALHHAAFLCDDYIKSGWKDVVTRDSRVSVADAHTAAGGAGTQRGRNRLGKARCRGGN